MLQVAVNVQRSTIHGLGVFAVEDIRAGQLVWRFEPELDRIVSRDDLKGEYWQFLYHFCYINPAEPLKLILCLDHARYMNFSKEANTVLGEKYFGEHDLVASMNIKAGEEITVPFESDADAERKMTWTS